MTHQEYTVPIDVLTDETAEHINPEQQAELWQQEINELGQLLPPESHSRYTLDTLSQNAGEWYDAAQRVSQTAAEEVPATLPKKYDAYQQQALHSNAPHSQRVAIGGASAPLHREYPTAQAVDGTLSQSIPPNMFEGLFASPLNQTPRQATVQRAHQQTVHAANTGYEQNVKAFFAEEVLPKIEGATQANPAELSQDIMEELAETTDAKMSPALDALREAIMGRRAVGIGSVAISEQFRAEQSVQDAARAIRTALQVPMRYTNGLNDIVDSALQKRYGLPGAQEIAQHIAQMVDASRGQMVNRLHAQIASIVAQYGQGIHWQNMDVAPPQAPEKPKYQAEVDAEIKEMRTEGLSDNKIHRRLMMKYHTDGAEGDSNKAKYVSGLITKTKPEQGYRNN